MPLLSRLLLVPLLAPLLAVLLVAALNPRPALSLRLLTWSSPALPIGLWLALAGLGGGTLSAAATTLALGEGREPRRRTVRRPGRAEAAWTAPWEDELEEPRETPPQRSARPERQEPGVNAGPARPPGEPPPTLSVPFRVIRRAPAHAGPPRNTSAAAPARDAGPTVVSIGDGWDQPLSDSW